MSAAGATEDPHLLVVDDDDRLRALLQQYLTSNGFRVSAAADAEEARALMKSMAFDLLIVDVMMPGESGLDLTRSVRAQSQMPMLILTARGEPEDRIAGLEHGADDYLAKPFEPRELLLRCGALLRRADAAAALAASRSQDGRSGVRSRARRTAPQGQARAADEFRSGAAASCSRPMPAGLSRALDLCARLGVALERSIDVQVTRLRRKIEEDPKLPLYIQTVRGVGYVLVPDRVA